jgi:5-(carboxyamino)imidazole ribonucleotide synthase
MILPPAIIGILGGGQLGRYLALAAMEMGYRVWILDPDPASPAGQVAHRHLCAPYDDASALAELARHAAVVTFEFENVPLEAATRLAQETLVRPDITALEVAQDRIAEKRFLQQSGVRVTPWYPLVVQQDLDAIDEDVFPGVLKTARLGYDGKGQLPVVRAADLPQAWEQLAGVACVLERRVPLQREFSLVLACAADGRRVAFPAAENEHRDGILFLSRVPARIRADDRQHAEAIATRIADRLAYCGVLSIEFFITNDGDLLVNEIAPRTHNSGHYSLDATSISQFAQQVRAICGLRLAPVDLYAPGVMLNLLGDVYPTPDALPDFSDALDQGRARLHLYGKKLARPGRKMGHLTFLGAPGERDAGAAARVALQVWERFSQSVPTEEASPS